MICAREKESDSHNERLEQAVGECLIESSESLHLGILWASLGGEKLVCVPTGMRRLARASRGEENEAPTLLALMAKNE